MVISELDSTTTNCIGMVDNSTTVFGEKTFVVVCDFIFRKKYSGISLKVLAYEPRP